MGMSGVQKIEVAAGDGDQRLDRWFRRAFPHIAQGRIEKLCRKGDIRVDGGRVKANTRVQEGQIVRIPPLPDAHEITARAKTYDMINDADLKMMQDAVLYKDDDIIVINKPAGLPTQGGSKQTRHVDMLADALRFGYDQKPRLVHRLDKDTSGILLLARTRQVAAALTKSFRDRETRKVYWAAVGGCPSPKMGTVRYGLVQAGGHGPNGAGEKMICVHPDEVAHTDGAKRSTTDYMVVSAAAKRCAWVALVPITGRKHQLRVHMAEFGHPIIGDGKYGGSGQENQGDGWGAGLGGENSKKMHLHARYISLPHPVTGKTLKIVAPMPEHMQRTWDTFAWDARDVADDPFEEYL